MNARDAHRAATGRTHEWEHCIVVNIREVRLAAGAEFVVMVCGEVMTMPGLPKDPSAARIDIDDAGRITGLF